MAVRIRLKKMGRTHRPFYRICAFDHHTPRDGRALEELGTYDTGIRDTDARAILKNDRVDYWLSVGAQPTEKVAVLIKKYGTGGTHAEQQKAALENLAAPRTVPDPGALSAPKEPEVEPVAEAVATEGPAAEAEKTVSETAAADDTPAEESGGTTPEEENPSAAE
ncbi:MAG: 30S ribosomal protein S16 [Pirellulales bacterium]|nr:30S ribosomal protein S16 [Pirellulales bacterium]